MALKRECYIITYRFKNVFKRINKVKGLDIYYSSKRSRYITAYVDLVDAEKIIEEVKKIKGVQSVEKTKLDQAEININL